MKLTGALKSWLAEHKGVASDAEDSAFISAATEALADGSLTASKLAELTEEKEHKQASKFEQLLQTVVDGQKALGERITKLEEKPAEKQSQPATGESSGEGQGRPTPSKDAPPLPAAGEGDGNKTISVFDKYFASETPSDADPEMPLVRHITADKRYDATRREARFPEYHKAGARHALAGQRMFEGGDRGKRYIDEPSELDRAVSGAYFKWAMNSSLHGRVPTPLRMTDHDKELVQYALRSMNWGGVIHGGGDEESNAIGIKNERLKDWHIKAILDDAASGGLELAPIVFDDQVITTPLLTGEFFPLVNVVNLTRGRRVEGGSIGNVTLSSGGADGTAIPLFNTASFVAAFDTTIHVVNGAIEIGLDFLSDSPIAISDVVTGQYGQVLLAWLDEQIVLGDGTTEPEGITVAAGTTTQNAANGAGGPPTVGDYEALMFSPQKQFKQGFPTNRIVFGANETTYQRARAIAVGTSDARRIFGMSESDYMLFGHPYKINHNIGNRVSFFGVMPRYRMYRRLGLTLGATTEGKELTRANQMLITARARFGGQIETGSAFGVQSDGQS